MVKALASYLFYSSCSTGLTIMLVEIAINTRVQTFCIQYFLFHCYRLSCSASYRETFSNSFYDVCLSSVLNCMGGSIVIIKCKKGDFRGFSEAKRCEIHFLGI